MTKQELVDYYRRVSSWMEPHLRGRPVAMERYPDGIDKPGFLERTAISPGRGADDSATDDGEPLLGIGIHSLLSFIVSQRTKLSVLMTLLDTLVPA